MRFRRPLPQRQGAGRRGGLGIDRLSDEQRAAVEAAHPRFTVVAAAGSGKTRVLVERYVRFVREGVAPERLVTITFTNKAAADMKRRIVERLMEEGLRHQAQAAETGPVQTVHSFCERILRSQALAAGVDPDFKVADEEESARLRLQAVHDVLRVDLAGMPEAQVFVDRVGGDGTYRSTRLDSLLVESVREALSLRSTLVDPAVLGAWAASAEAVLAEQNRVLNAVTDGAVPLGASVQETIESLMFLKRADRRRSTWVPARVDAATERHTAEMTAGFLQLALKVWERMEAVMEARQSFDFALLERKALRLLASTEGGEAVRRQVDAVLVDEGQDLNPAQHALLQSLAAGQEMVVGDPRQSIYGFRQADVELFRARLTELPRLSLSRNYRSEPGLVRFIDKLYPLLTGEHEETLVDTDLHVDDLLGGVVEDFGGTVELLTCSDSGFADLTASRIAALVGKGVPAGEIAVLARHSKSGADVAERLRKLGVAATVIGGSKGFMTNIEVLDVANMLEALIDPSNDFALAAVLLSPFAGLSLDSVVHLNARKPIVASLQESRLADDDEQEKLVAFRGWFERQAGMIDRSTAWETLASLYAQTPFLNGLARQPDSTQALANVRKLLTIAAKSPDVGPIDFAHQIREMRTSNADFAEPEVDDDSQGAVRVSTIHKSKGLEFGHVFLPDMHVKDPPPGRVLVDARSESVVFGGKESLMASWLIAEGHRRNSQELKRVFYVGLTRAKTRAYVTLQTGKSDGLTPELVKQLGVPGRTWPGVTVWAGPDKGE